MLQDVQAHPDLVGPRGSPDQTDFPDKGGEKDLQSTESLVMLDLQGYQVLWDQQEIKAQLAFPVKKE